MKIRLFVDAHVFDGLPQGTVTYIRGLYSSLVNDDRFEITLAARDTALLRASFSDKRFRFYRIKSKSSLLRLCVEFPFHFLFSRYDYAHFQYIIPLFSRCRIINTIHDLLFLEYPDYFPARYKLFRRFSFSYSARRSDLLCTVSEYSRNSIGSLFGIDRKRIHLTPNGIDAALSGKIAGSLHGLPQKYLLYVSRFEPRKNHGLLLRAWRELDLASENTAIVFVGKRDDIRCEAYDEELENLPGEMKSRVVHYEGLSQEQLSAVYFGCSLFVYPSLAEGFGIPPLEAAMHGCRVVCSDRTAMKDFDFFGDYRFDAEDLGSLKRSITRALSDENYPHEHIRNEIMRRYHRPRIAASFAQLLISRHT